MTKPQTLYASPVKNNTNYLYSAGDETIYDADLSYDTALIYNGGATGTDIVDKPTVEFATISKPTVTFTRSTKSVVEYTTSQKQSTAVSGVVKTTTGNTGVTKPASWYVVNPEYSSSLYVDSGQEYNDSEVTYLGNDGTQEQYNIKNRSSYSSNQKTNNSFSSPTKPTTEYSQ